MSYKVGSQVELRCRSKSIYLFSEEEYEYFTIKGTVIQPFYSTEKKSVFVRTTDQDIPIRVVAVDRIDGYNAIDDGDDDTKIIPVGQYFVTVTGGKVSCTCVGFQFRRYCKHSTPYKEV